MPDTQISTRDGGYHPGASDALATLVYRSRAVEPLSASELYRLTLESRDRNRRESITGVLLYDESRIFQWLEGPPDCLDRLMYAIRKDPRHTDIEILNQQSTRQRAFGDWSMKLATRGPSAALWQGEVIEPPPEMVADLRSHPHAAPTMLVHLLPQGPEADDPNASSLDPADGAQLGRATSAILKDVVRAVLLPKPATLLEPRRLAANPRTAELADLLIGADQKAARQLIDELHATDGSAQRLFSTLFEPAARRLGDLWAEDFCSEFEVTLALCRLQSTARLLTGGTPQLPSQPGRRATVLIAPEPGELHRLGAALDSETLWHAGWAPHCAFPTNDTGLQDLVATTWFDVLDMSLSAAFQRVDWLPRLARTIESARQASQNPAMLVVVGGRVFADDFASAPKVGADMTSRTALSVGEVIMDGIAKRDEKTRPV